MNRKLHQTIRHLKDSDADVKRKMKFLKKDLGIRSDSEIVRYCVTQVFNGRKKK